MVPTCAKFTARDFLEIWGIGYSRNGYALEAEVLQKSIRPLKTDVAVKRARPVARKRFAASEGACKSEVF